jgi:hypothetical protein
VFSILRTFRPEDIHPDGGKAFEYLCKVLRNSEEAMLGGRTSPYWKEVFVVNLRHAISGWIKQYLRQMRLSQRRRR